MAKIVKVALIFLVTLFFVSCSRQLEFDKESWIDGNESVRGAMINSTLILLETVSSREILVQQLGQPDEFDQSNYYYQFCEQGFNFFISCRRSLVISLDEGLIGNHYVSD